MKTPAFCTPRSGALGSLSFVYRCQGTEGVPRVQRVSQDGEVGSGLEFVRQPL